MIEYIEVNRLHEHPDNPRKSIGDVAELAESIKSQGLLQNLTVVPHPELAGEYRILIGHRRFNAAKRAGLEKLPCVIDSKTDYKGQIAIMMSENMQRNDLTISERVGGVQMMLDLGMDEKGVSSQTGLSLSTVKRYRKLSGIKGGIKRAEENGATLTELAMIAEIEYEDLREEALQKAGQQDISHVIYRARQRKETETYAPKLVTAAQKFARRTEKYDYFKYDFAKGFALDAKGLKELEEYKPKKGQEHIFCVEYGRLNVYRKKEEDPQKAEKQKAAEKLRARERHEREIAESFRGARRIYMEGFRVTKETEDAAKRFLLYVLTTKQYNYVPQLGGTLDAAYLKKREVQPESYTGSVTITPEEIFEWDAKSVLSAAVLAAYDRIDNGNLTILERYSAKPVEPSAAAHIKAIYEFLKGFGYKASDEERAWLDGMHECFTYPHEEDV